MPEALTQASTESKIFDKSGPEEPIESKAPVEEHIVTEARTQAPIEPKETAKSKAPAEKLTVPKAPIGAKKAKEAKEAEEAEGKTINTTEMVEIWGPSSMALPQLNCSPSSPPVQAGSSKPAGNYDSAEPIHTSSLLLPATLRARRRRRPCKRGSCMSLPRLRRW